MAPACSNRWSTPPETCAPRSREKPMQEPARRGFRPVEPRAIEPEAPPQLILDGVIVAQLPGFRGVPPPLAQDALRPVGAAHPVLPAAPVKDPRRVVGQRR